MCIPRGTLFTRPFLSSWVGGAGPWDYTKLVSCPDPTPKRRKGSGTHQALFGSYWLGMSEFCRTNQSCAMWLTCDYHVIPHYSQLLLLVRAVDALLCQNDALSWQSHDELHPVRPRKHSCVPDPFLTCVVMSGNETNVQVELVISIIIKSCSDS